MTINIGLVCPSVVDDSPFHCCAQVTVNDRPTLVGTGNCPWQQALYDWRESGAQPTSHWGLLPLSLYIYDVHTN